MFDVKSAKHFDRIKGREKPLCPYCIEEVNGVVRRQSGVLLVFECPKCGKILGVNPTSLTTD